MDRLDENVKEEADGIHNSLGNKNLRMKLNSDSFYYCSYCGKYDRISTIIMC